MPKERYDKRLNRNISVSNYGEINLKKLFEDSKNDDKSNLRKLQREYNLLKNKYDSLNQDFELMYLNNNELKNTIYKIKEEKEEKEENIKYKEEEYSILKEENKNIKLKLDEVNSKIVILNMNINKKEEDYENLLKKIKELNENLEKNNNSSGRKNNFDGLKISNGSEINFIGVQRSQIVN